MPKVKILASAFSGEEIVEQAVATVMAQANGNGPFPAEPKRDANGKITEVVIGVPDNEKANLGNMKDAIGENPGAASVISFPIEDEQSYETGSDGDPVTSLDGEGIWTYTLQDKFDTVLRAANAISGTKSLALEYNDGASTTFHRARLRTLADLVPNYGTPANICTLSAKVQAYGAKGNNFYLRRVLLSNGGWLFAGSGVGGNWHYELLGSNVLVDTGVPDGDVLDFSWKIDTFTDEVTLSIGGTIVGTQAIYPTSALNGIGFRFDKQDSFSAAQTLTGGFRFDDFDFKILA